MAEKRELSRREMRRKRRIRNQIFAYGALCILLAALAAGLFVGGKKIISHIEEKRQEKQLEEDLLAMQESMEQTGESEESQETVEEYTDDDLLNDMVDASIADMPLEDQVAGLFLTTPEELTGVGKVTVAGDGMKESLSQYAVGGLVFTSQSVSPSSLGVDQFGEIISGTVTRSKYPMFFILDNDEEELEEMSAYGFNMWFDGKEAQGDQGNILCRTAILPELLGGSVSGEDQGLSTVQITSEDEEALADLCMQAWEDGADLLYVPKGLRPAYEGMLSKISEDSARQDKLVSSLERIYRVKYIDRANTEDGDE